MKLELKDFSLNTKFEWLEERTILLSPVGSQVYGTAVEGSDYDYRGVCIPPIDYYLGLNSFNEYNNSGGKDFDNGQDISISHINKFVKDAMKGVPNNIEILFVPQDKLVYVNELGQMLIDNRHLFLSKRVRDKFGGYARSMIKQIQMEKGRKELIEKYGYDTKAFMHGVRLLTSAIEILITGDYSTERPNKDFLLKCRNGEYTPMEATDILDQYDRELQTAYEVSKLPDNPDYDKINNMLININRQALEL